MWSYGVSLGVIYINTERIPYDSLSRDEIGGGVVAGACTPAMIVMFRYRTHDVMLLAAMGVLAAFVVMSLT